MEESDGRSGLDGTSTSIVIQDGDRRHRVYRWCPRSDTGERGLEDYVALIDRLIEVSGVRGRRFWERLDRELVEIRIAVPSNFNGAAKLFESRQRKTVEELLVESWLDSRSGAYLRLEAEEGIIIAKLDKSASIGLAKMIGELFDLSDESIYNRLLDLVPPAGTGEDPFAGLVNDGDRSAEPVVSPDVVPDPRPQDEE